MKYLKHILLWAAVVITSAPFVLPTFFQIQQEVAQHEMKEKIEHANLVTLSLDSTAVIWEKKGKEIWVDNMLFDIKKASYVNGRLIVQGLFDYKEKAIISKLNSLTSSFPFQKERNHTIFKILHLEGILFSSSEIHEENILASIHAPYRDKTLDPSFHITSPPPEYKTMY